LWCKWHFWWIKKFFIDDVLIREIKEVTNWEYIPTRVNKPNYVIRQLNSIQEKLGWRLEDLKQTIESIAFQWDNIDIPENLLKEKFWESLSVFDSNLSSTDLLSEFFTEDFFFQIWNTDCGINLNRETEMYFGDFNQGYFTDIPELVDEPVHIFSATRSDSHEDDETFKQDIKQNLQALTPWGILTTDGAKASLSRIYRFQEISQVIRELWINNFKAEVVVDSVTRRPLSVFIQKKHPKWYLNQSEKKKFFDKNIEFSTLEQTLARPYIKIVNKVRKKLFEITKVGEIDGTVDIFKKFQSQIKSATEKALLDKAIENETTDYIESIIVGIIEIFSQENGIQEQDLTDATQQLLDHDPIFQSVLSFYKGRSLQEVEKTLWLKILAEMNDYSSIDEYKKYLRQKIRINEETNILDLGDIKAVTSTVEAKVEKLLHLYEWDLSVTESWSLRPLKRWHNYTYPRYWENWDFSDINRRFHAELTSLPDNSELLWRDEIFQARKERFKKNINTFCKKIRNKVGVPWFKPIVFLSYQDCITNEFMLEELKRIFWSNWVKDNVLVLNMSFRPLDKVSTETIRHIQAIQDQLWLYYEHGGIIIWWWSWTDAYDKFGLSFKEHIWQWLLEALEKNPRLRQLAVCASYQVMADLIGNKYYDGLIKTRPGMAQFWPTNVWIWKSPNNSQPKHAIFRDIPDYFTASMTHTWWVSGASLWKKSLNSWKLNFIAWDVLTWNPIAYSSMDDRLVWMQWHPEIDLTQPDILERLESELQEEVYRKHFLENFKVGSWRIMYPFRDIVWWDSPHLKRDSWEFILINTLELLSKGLDGIS